MQPMKNQTFTPESEPEQHPKGKFTLLYLTAIVLLGISIYLIFAGGSQAEPTPRAPLPTPSRASTLESLLYSELPKALAQQEQSNLTLDNIQFNQMKTQALLWMTASDAETGEVLAREPEVIIALWNEKTEQWELIFANEAGFEEALAASDLSSTEVAARFLDYDPNASTSGVTYGGYYLPWQAGLTKRLTWSVGHTSCANNYCIYAFDFADGTMFQIAAAKAGYVYHYKDTCANGDPNCTNSITIQDRTTTPYTYNIYLHIAQGSVPANIRQTGTYVFRGQIIVRADDTGYSSGHHLHFMVVEQTTLNGCTNYCWGKSVDITFRDVSINWDPVTQGGRPRLPEEAEWYGGEGQRYYTSGNIYYPFRYQLYLPIIRR
jgi:hypothetical protein